MNQERIKNITGLQEKINSEGPLDAAADIGILNGEAVLLLSETIEAFHHQIPLTIAELRGTIRNVVDSSIAENERLAKSNDRHSRAMFWLTVVLAIAAVIQAASAFIQWQVEVNAIDVQSDMYSLEVAKWEYEKMRADRLEQREVDWRRTDLELQQSGRAAQ